MGTKTALKNTKTSAELLSYIINEIGRAHV